MKIIQWIRDLFWKCYNNRVLRYIFYGGLTTLVNLVVYYTLRLLFSVPMTPANVVSVAAAIVFAYIVNARFVFESKAKGIREKAVEFFAFVGARLSTMVIEVGGVWFMAEVIMISDLAGKLIIQVVILILNYIFSRFIVFRKKG